MRYVLVVLAFVIGWIGLASARGSECSSPDRVISDVAAWNNGSIVEPFYGDPLRSFLKAMNSTPPVTHYTGETALIISKKGARNVVVVLFRAGCATHTLTMRPELFRAYSNSI